MFHDLRTAGLRTAVLVCGMFSAGQPDLFLFRSVRRLCNLFTREADRRVGAGGRAGGWVWLHCTPAFRLQTKPVSFTSTGGRERGVLLRYFRSFFFGPIAAPLGPGALLFCIRTPAYACARIRSIRRYGICPPVPVVLLQRASLCRLSLPTPPAVCVFLIVHAQRRVDFREPQPGDGRFDLSLSQRAGRRRRQSRRGRSRMVRRM